MATTKSTTSKKRTVAKPTPNPEVEAATVLRRKEFLRRVSERTGLRPNKVKPVMEAVLAELGDGLVGGEDIALPPLGKLSVNKRKERPNMDVLIVKYRRAKPAAETDAPDPLATAAE